MIANIPRVGVPPTITEFSRIPPTTPPNKLIPSASAARPCVLRLPEKIIPEKKTGRATHPPPKTVYVLVAIVRKRLGLEASLYQTLQILSVTLFEKTPILCALQALDADADFAENVDQLILFAL